MIVWDFIAEREGGRQLDGYVPQGSTASGVTVYCGIDLGRLTKAEVVELPPALADNVRPYLGLHGDAARRALREAPLHITAADGRALMGVKARGLSRDLVAHFDPKSPVPFDRLPDGPATVIMSVTWQYGDPWADEKCGDFWRIACRCDWKALASYLTAPPSQTAAYFPDRRFVSRRRLEGEFLLKAVSIFDGKLVEGRV